MKAYLFKVLSAAFMFCLIAGCSEQKESHGGNNHDAITDSVITATYPKIYQKIFSRDDAAILRFASHESKQIRAQAWRALAQTPVDSLSSFIATVIGNGSDQAWFALSMHPLQPAQLRDLEEYWTEHPDHRPGVSLVLGRQGDARSLDFLTNRLVQITGSTSEKETALAVSRLILRFGADEKRQLQIINAAFSGTGNGLRPWLYGFYRGDDGMLAASAKDSLLRRWRAFGPGKNANLDQYIAGIAGGPVFSEIVQKYADEGVLDEQVQLAIELARLVDEVNLTARTAQDIRTLLAHPNPHVKGQTLAALSDNIAQADSLFSHIKNQLLDDKQTPPSVWLQALLTLSGADTAVVQNYSSRLDAIADSHAYLLPLVLDVRMQTESTDALLARIDQTAGRGTTLHSMQGLNVLDDIWSDAANKDAIRAAVRGIVFKALARGDRGVTFSAQSLLQKSDLFAGEDFERINGYLNNFKLPDDIEVYQAFGSLYKQRFEQQARPVIDSLAALGYVPLNRSLKQDGWEVDIEEKGKPEFRRPDWSQLWELGEHPVWVLETEKGTIKVKMNTLSAPVTVSAIDSLTRAGAYNGVPFHRVVPNFVIQGGDIERGDGMGGPDFTLPTEPTEHGFVRGAAGIASAGPDTEGSQYFFMHQWKPHLNGGYTLFGEVLEGMDIVDRIIVGDTVSRAYWE